MEDFARGRWFDAVASWQAIRHQRRKWEGRVETWDSHSSSTMKTVIDSLISQVEVAPGVVAMDLGTGTGPVALRLAAQGADVVAVDVSPSMIGRLLEKAERLGLSGVKGKATPIEQLCEPPDAYDLVVSNYALHHLRDADKARLVRSAFGWLRPGGQLLISDMMFGRGATAADRRIITQKVRTLAARGLPGFWRILKNSFRFMIRVQERPLSQSAWRDLLTAAGFTDIHARSVVAEAGLVSGRKPVASLPSTAPRQARRR
ncbi:MAG: class I SAM-dependent methyltransferase [Acidimicrobiales bacterium]